MFITKTPNQENGIIFFIEDSGATSQMVNSEGNMTNLKDIETRFTIGDSRTLTKKRDDCYGYHIHDGKLHSMKLSHTYVIPGLHANIFSVT